MSRIFGKTGLTRRFVFFTLLSKDFNVFAKLPRVMAF